MFLDQKSTCAPELAGRFLTTRPPGKPHGSSDKQKCLKFIVTFISLILAFRLGTWGYYLRQPVLLWGPHCLPSLGAHWGSHPFEMASPGNGWPQRGLSLLIFWNDCWVLMGSGLQHWFPDTALSLLGLESFRDHSIPLHLALNSAVWGLASKWAAVSGTKLLPAPVSAPSKMPLRYQPCLDWALIFYSTWIVSSGPIRETFLSPWINDSGAEGAELCPGTLLLPEGESQDEPLYSDHSPSSQACLSSALKSWLQLKGSLGALCFIHLSIFKVLRWSRFD